MLFKNVDKCVSQKYPKFIYDEACLDIYNTLNKTVTVLGQYTECHDCKFQNLTELEPHENTSVLVYTRFPIQLHYVYNDNNNTPFCSFQKLLHEHYRYGWNLTEKCNPTFIKEQADNAYLPILMAFIVLFCFGTLWYMVKCIYKNSGVLRRLIVWNGEMEADLGTSMSSPLVIERTPTPHKHPNRIKSIDVFRGLCIIVMIFVNYGGGQYWFFRHSVWNGLTVADLVFPWFLWIMGLSLSISLQKKLRRAIPRRQLVMDIIRRSFLLILLGIIINSNHNLSTIGSLRFPGVLQRIGLTYLIIAILEVIFTKRSELVDNVSCVYDVSSAWPQWLFILTLTIIHTCITFLVDVPGCGKGYLGPGGLDEGGKYYNCTGGVAGFIDRSVFGEHMYKNPTCKKLYETNVYYDPEGLLGTLTALLTVYFGVQAGRTFNTYQNVKARVARWIIWGFVTCLLGGCLCEFMKNDGLIPINKQLWSLSYVLILAGMSFLIQAFLYFVVDVSRKWGGRPFFYPGMNSIFLYVGHELFKNTFPFAWTPVYELHGIYLFMNLWGTFLWVAVSIYLYKRNVFFTI